MRKSFRIIGGAGANIPLALLAALVISSTLSLCPAVRLEHPAQEMLGEAGVEEPVFVLLERLRLLRGAHVAAIAPPLSRKKLLTTTSPIKLYMFSRCPVEVKWTEKPTMKDARHVMAFVE
jgi:hypothetical protein